MNDTGLEWTDAGGGQLFVPYGAKLALGSPNYFLKTGSGLEINTGNGDSIRFIEAGAERARVLTGGKFLVGRSTDNAGGVVQVGDHSIPAGGFGFRAGLSLYSSLSDRIRTDEDFQADNAYFGSVYSTTGYNLPTAAAYYNNGVAVVGPRKTGWTAPTGTAQRGTFATDSVSLVNLARCVKALVDDLTSHGLIGA